MNVQDDRIRSACEALAITAMSEQYPLMAEQAAKKESSYANFLEQCLLVEQEER